MVENVSSSYHGFLQVFWNITGITYISKQICQKKDKESYIL